MAKIPEDLTIVYYTANVIPEQFANVILRQLVVAAEGLPIITVAQKPMSSPGEDVVILGLPRHHLSIYKQALVGAQTAKTKYIALVEDDVLYSPEHFKHRPSPGKFAYNMNAWNIFTWTEPIFTQKLGGRKNLNGLICERELFIEAITERFDSYPDESNINLSLWAEPGKYERQLGVTVREFEEFVTNPPNIIFSHETALSFEGLGTKKRMGEVRATDIPYWGSAEEARGLYGN